MKLSDQAEHHQPVPSRNSIYEISVKRIDGAMESMRIYEGKLLLIVNVASSCVFTSQYEGLENLYQKYRDNGLVVLGFPCNQFLMQESGSESEIQIFCSTNYNVTFPMFSKIKVNGFGTHELFRYLKRNSASWLGIKAIRWNFTKFLVSPDGLVVERFGPGITPEAIGNRIAEMLCTP